MRTHWIAGAAALLLPVSAQGQDALAPVTLDGHQLVLSKPVLFKPGSARMADGAAAALTSVKTYLESKAYISALRIEGHVRSGGESGQTLSEARARAVAQALIAQGIDCKRLILVGFGNTKPVAAPGATANERITFANAALRGRAIGGLPLDGGGHTAGNACALPH